MTEHLSGWTQIARFSHTARAEQSLIGQALGQQGIRHHWEYQPEVVTLWIEDAARVDETVRILGAVRQQLSRQTGSGGVSSVLRDYPVVVMTILGSLIGAFLVSFRFDLVHHFTFQDFILSGDRVGFYPLSRGFETGQYWRLLTPAFLHFGVFHLLFNCLWLWELGRRIERLAGSYQLLLVVLITAVTANVGQYAWGGPSLFGGMSGVVYGLLGYIWMRHRLSPHPLLAVPPGLVVFMLAWLVICMTGLVNLFMSGSVANAAHVGGLLAGLVLGWWSGSRR